VLIFYFYFIFIFFVELLVLLVFTRWLSVQFSISKAYAAIHLCCVGIKFFHGDISIYLRLLEMVCVSTFFMSIFVWYDIFMYTSNFGLHNFTFSQRWKCGDTSCFRVSSLPFLFNLLKHLFSLYFHFFLSQFCYCRSNCIPSTGFVNSNLAWEKLQM
jgi:hypothetical protein